MAALPGCWQRPLQGVVVIATLALVIPASSIAVEGQPEVHAGSPNSSAGRLLRQQVKIREPVRAGISAESRQCAAVVLGPLLLASLAGLARLTLQGQERCRATAAGSVADALVGPAAAVALGVVALDCAVSTVCFPALLDLGAVPTRGDDAATLYLARPIGGITAMMLAPLLLRAGARCGQLVVAVGLLTLALSYLALAVGPSFARVLVAYAAGAAASGAIFTSAVHALMLEAPSVQSSTRGYAALFGLATACACMPRVISTIVKLLGLQLAMVTLCAVVMAACCLFLTLATWAAELSFEKRAGLALVWEPAGALFAAVSDTLQDARRLRALVGIGLSAAALSLHTALLPDRILGAAAGSPRAESAELVLPEGAGGVVLGLWLLACGRCAIVHGEQWGLHGLVVALVVSILGLRTTFQGHSSSTQHLVSIGWLSSHAGLGGCLGISLALLLKRCSYCGAFRSAAACAVASAALGVAWLLGDALGIATQMLLYPLVGLNSTVSALALALAAHAATVMVAPDWQPAGDTNARGAITRKSLS